METPQLHTIENVKMERAPDDKFPRCPYCKSVLETIWVKSEGMGFTGQELLMMCPYCESFLGYNAWKR